MFHLLTETSIFVVLPNDCYCQMTGEPIIYLKAPQFSSFGPQVAEKERDSSGNELLLLRKREAEPHMEERHPKRLKLSHSTSTISSNDALLQTKEPKELKRYLVSLQSSTSEPQFFLDLLPTLRLSEPECSTSVPSIFIVQMSSWPAHRQSVRDH